MKQIRRSKFHLLNDATPCHSAVLVAHVTVSPTDCGRSRVGALEQMAQNMQRDTENILEMQHGAKLSNGLATIDDVHPNVDVQPNGCGFPCFSIFFVQSFHVCDHVVTYNVLFCFNIIINPCAYVLDLKKNKLVVSR